MTSCSILETAVGATSLKSWKVREPAKEGSFACPSEVCVTLNVTNSPCAIVAFTSGLLELTVKVCEADVEPEPLSGTWIPIPAGAVTAVIGMSEAAIRVRPSSGSNPGLLPRTTFIPARPPRRDAPHPVRSSIRHPPPDDLARRNSPGAAADLSSGVSVVTVVPLQPNRPELPVAGVEQIRPPAQRDGPAWRCPVFGGSPCPISRRDQGFDLRRLKLVWRKPSSSCTPKPPP